MNPTGCSVFFLFLSRCLSLSPLLSVSLSANFFPSRSLSRTLSLSLRLFLFSLFLFFFQIILVCHCPFYLISILFLSTSFLLSLTFFLSGLSHSHFALIHRIKISHPTLCPPLHMMIQNYHVLKLPTDKLYFKLSSAVPSIVLIRIPSCK